MNGSAAPNIPAVSRPSMASTVLSDLRLELQPSNVLPALFSGLIIGATMVLWSVTIAALVFNGALESYVARGTGYFLFGSMVLALVMALMSSYRGLIAGSDEAAAIILSLVASTISAALLPSTELEVVFTTVMVVVVLSTMLSGLVFLALGRFRLGNLVRYVPYPVVGGVIVTMGWLITVGAFEVMVDQDIEFDSLPLLTLRENLVLWVPGTLFAVVLVVATRVSSHYLVLPGLFATALCLFYLSTRSLGLSMDDLEAAGWLLGPFPDQSPWVPVSFSALDRLDWSLVAGQAGSVGSLILLCLLGLLLSGTGVEVAAKKDMDINHELTSAGVANVLAALGGGVTGSHSVEDSLLAREMGAPFRLTGVITAAVCLLALLFGISLLSYLPKTLLGGFILFFGLMLIVEWVYDGWSRLPRADYGVVILCLVVCASVGYLAGIVVGIVSGGMIFVVNYSRVSVIKHALSGGDYHSNVERDSDSTDFLNRCGDQIYLLELDGFIFFGTAHKVLDRIKERLAREDSLPLAYLILDFRNVSDIDTSTVSSFIKMKQLAERGGFRILLTNASPDILGYLARGDVVEAEDPVIRVVDDVDRALEWCEDQLLTAASLTFPAPGKTRSGTLSEQFPDPGMLASLRVYLELHHAGEGEFLIRQGAESSDLFLIESGRVAVQLELASGKSVRLRSMGAGTIVGEVALYLGIPRSASVVAEVPTVAYKLTLDALKRMKEDDPSLAATFHTFVVRLVAARLAATNRLVQALHGP